MATKNNKKAEQKSPEVQMVERLCRINNRNMFARVQHPVRTDWMMAYSVILDLATIYHWSEPRINQWFQFARER